MKLNHTLLEELYSQGKSYKEIVEITGYNKNSVYGYFHKTKGKMEDPKRYRRNRIPLTERQKEVLFGTLMGDGNIQKQKLNSYSGRFNHSIKQVEYLKHIKSELDNLTTDVRYFTSKTADKEYPSCYFSLKNNYELKYFYELFYQGKKRNVPKDLSLLTPRAMAYWFMDDGSASSGCTISIATNSFSLEGLLRLKKFLKKTYDIEVTITKEFRLYFPAESGRKFCELIKDYIIPEMMYKFKFI